MYLPSPWSSPRGSLSSNTGFLADAGMATRRASARAAKAWIRLNRIRAPEEEERGAAWLRPPFYGGLCLEPDFHERLEALLFEVAVDQAVPAAEAAPEARRAHRHAEVAGDVGV